jgi:uncharacterized protein (DUF433 family)
MDTTYVEQRDDGYWIAGTRVAGTRVSLASVVLAFRQGRSPETITSECFPMLTLEHVYGALTYYLTHQQAIDAYLEEADAEFAAFSQAVRSADPDFARHLTAPCRQIQITGS